MPYAASLSTLSDTEAALDEACRDVQEQLGGLQPHLMFLFVTHSHLGSDLELAAADPANRGREGVPELSAPLRSRSRTPPVKAASATWLMAMVRSYPSGDSARLENAAPALLTSPCSPLGLI